MPRAAAERLYGWSAEEAIGRPIRELTVPEPMQDFAAELMQELEAGRSWSGAFTVRRKDGSTFPALVTDTGLRDPAGRLIGIVGASIDFGAAVEPFLRRSYEASVVTDQEGMIRLVSPGITALTGWSLQDLVGTSWWGYVHPEDRPIAQAAHERTVRTQELTPPVEQRVRRPDGSWVWVDASKTNLLDEPMVRGVLVTLRDVTERRAWVEELTQRALHDALTGLVNRAVFMEHLESHLARRQHAGAVLYVDLDDFKGINDRYGHEAGDAVLQAVAHRLRESVRPEDVCGRLGGDEFAVLSAGVSDAWEAVTLAQRVSTHVAQPLSVGGTILRPKASVGVALLTETVDPDRAIRLADEDMYLHKRSGRPGVP